jgi:hypothetical protein
MPALAPSPRFGHEMAFDSARGVSVLFGGYDNISTYNETWEWGGGAPGASSEGSWSLRTPFFSPTPRIDHAMAYDSRRGVTVLFGGDNFDQLNNETWEWNGTNWSLMFPATVPAARYAAAMAFDSARGVTVLFGGFDDHAPFGDTWEWDGKNWLQRITAIAPSARYGHAMAYDSHRSVTVLLNGVGISFNADTWEWDGTNWSQRSPGIVPDERSFHAMAYDSLRDAVVLFGGFAGAQNGETFEWNGTTWLFRLPNPAPSARSSHAMAFDAARRMTVLFGGRTGANFTPNNQTWEWTGPRPGVIEQPLDQNVAIGQSVTFSVIADGENPLIFSWSKDGAPLSDGGTVAGSATPTLSISPAIEADTGAYTCKVSNPCGSVLSRAAALVVRDPCHATDPAGDCNGNGILDSCEIAADASLDTNGNGSLDACEELNSTSPACGACGNGLPAMMGIAAVLMAAVRIGGINLRRGMHPTKLTYQERK